MCIHTSCVAMPADVPPAAPAEVPPALPKLPLSPRAVEMVRQLNVVHQKLAENDKTIWEELRATRADMESMKEKAWDEHKTICAERLATTAALKSMRADMLLIQGTMRAERRGKMESMKKDMLLIQAEFRVLKQSIRDD